MARILVGSVFARDDEIQRKWLDLQLAFLKATTSSFEHIALVWGGVKDSYFYDRTTVVEPESQLEGSEAYFKGLQNMLRTFCHYQQNFEGFLFLDSDAFPIRMGWQDMLTNKMESMPAFYDGRYIPTLQTADKEYEVAMPFRAENLETRASVLYANKDALNRLSFASGKGVGIQGRRNMIGDLESDIYVPLYEKDTEKVWPLLRSNKHNVHPVACGVYYDMFYHHCCGSRAFGSRSDDYWNVKIDTNFTDRLMEDPTGFIRDLAGWSPDKYAKV